MSTIITVKSADQFMKVLENAMDKLVAAMFFLKNNPQSRTARQHFERSMNNNSITIFCIIDMDIFEGDDRMITGITVPHCDFYHLSIKIGYYSGSDQKGIEDHIRIAQQYVMKKNNEKNQQQSYYQQQLNQQSRPVERGYISEVQTTVQPVMQSVIQPIMQPAVQPVMQQPIGISPTSLGMDLPTFQQMQYFFKIFQMMNEMGVLNMSATVKNENKEITLANGDKLVPLADGNYGLIKKT